MSTSSANDMRSACEREDNAIAPSRSGEDQPVVPMHRMLHDSIEESGWKHEAVALAIGLPRENGKFYLSKMLAGEKAITSKHVNALPREIRRIFARRQAESLGLIVVLPLTGEEARRAFVAGALGLLTSGAFPLQMAKAMLARAKAANE